MKIKTVEQLAKEYRKTTPNQMYGDELGFIAGFSAKEKLEKIPKPIGQFIIDNAKGVLLEDGMYYHYTEVIKLLKLYEN